MDKILIVIAASSPFLAFLVRVACWFITDAVRQRRRTRAARVAHHCGDNPRPDHHQDRHGQAPAA